MLFCSIATFSNIWILVPWKAHKYYRNSGIFGSATFYLSKGATVSTSINGNHVVVTSMSIWLKASDF